MSTLLRAVQKRFRRPQSQLQILSDLHLEVGKQYSSFTCPATAPYLVLAGDIGRLIDYDEYLAFLEGLVPGYRKVFLVLGNHEFYGLDYDSGLEMACRLSEEPSLKETVVLLNRTRWDDPDSDLTILGCTLWSAVPEEASAVIESGINDFKRITEWTSQKHNAAHVEEAKWLREQVAQVTAQASDSQRQLLVVTHHAPCIEGTSHPTHSNSPWTAAFATDLLAQGGWDGVKIWVFGHTHYSTCFQTNGILLIANQRGYFIQGREIETSKGRAKHSRPFDPAKIIRLWMLTGF